MPKIKDRPEYRSKAPVMCFPPDTPVHVAVSAMSAKNYGAAVVVDTDQKPVGIVTERDFMRRLLDKNLDPQTTKLSDIMTRDVKVAAPDDEIVDWMQRMSKDRFRHVPVVDADGRLINMMSLVDFVSYTWPALLGQVRDRAISTIFSKYQIVTAIAVVALYTIIMVKVIK